MYIFTKCTKPQCTLNVHFIKSLTFTIIKHKSTILIKSTFYKNPIKSFPINPTTPPFISTQNPHKPNETHLCFICISET